MFCQLFGNYLQEREVINEFDYRQLIKEQMSVRVKLGTIAVMDGILTEAQVEKINELQKTQDRRFGDIAVEQGLLTDEQVGGLLKKQGNAYLQFVQLLMDMTDISKEKLEEYLEDFRTKIGFAPDEMEKLKKDDLDELLPMFVYSSKPYVLDIAGLLTRNITRFVSRDFYIEKARKSKEMNYTHLACQKIAGDHTVYIAIAEAEEQGAFLQVASAFSKQDMDAVYDDAYDAVCEFINVNSGLLASALSEKAVNIDMDPPQGYAGQVAKGDFYVLPVVLEGRRLELLIAVDSEFEPGQEAMQLGSVTTEEDTSEGEGARVLIVDDSRMSRQMLRNILEKDGYRVVMEASNGLEGLAAYMKCKPDLVTLDITMPEMDGLEALEKILAYDPKANAIMITAAGQQDKLMRALRAGAKYFISKPFNEDEILANIRKVLA